MKPLEGRVALITGASRGIGRAVAQRLAASGGSVYLAADGTAEELAAVAAACEAAGAARAAWGLHDLSLSDSPNQMVAEAARVMGRVDILVNNAGIRIRKAFCDFTAEDYDRVMAINLRAPFMASQAAVPLMLAQGGGRIIHMSSTLGIVASRYAALYNVAKGGLIQLTRTMALELSSQNILVNAVCPGPIATEGFIAGRNPGELEQRARDVPIGRFGTAEEVAGVVAFLCSNDATYMAGHALVMDGGYVIH